MHLSDRWWRKSSYLSLVLSIPVPASEEQSPTALPGSHLAPKLTISEVRASLLLNALNFQELQRAELDYVLMVDQSLFLWHSVFRSMKNTERCVYTS